MSLVRLQKFLAEAGVASRRASEQLILSGRVSVNGQPVTQLGTRVDPARDQITFEGRALKTKRKLYVALHKPPRYLCSRSPAGKRRLIGELLPAEWGNLYSVGRLDYESEGLIFLTNDGEFSLKLTHPRYGIRKIYRVTVEGLVEREHLSKMTAGVTHEGEKLRADKARLLAAGHTYSELELELTEGKNREVRRLLESLGLKVDRLKRIQIGPIKLGELPVGKWRTLTEPEIKSLIPKL